jgi:thioredoxin reductase (NADPH)
LDLVLSPLVQKSQKKYEKSMAKPIIVIVDDDPEVLQAVVRDLRRHYGDRYRLIRADSGHSALDAIQQLKLRNESVALFLVDQRMPKMTGVEFLEKATEVFKNAKKVLLTAYADTDAAIRAINRARLDYYLLKPWDPPEEKLYPVLDDLLNDWQASYRPPFAGIRVVGDRWSPLTHKTKDFLARNQIPYKWLDIETEAEATKLLAYADGHLPLVVFPDGECLSQPTAQQIAAKIGLKTQAEQPFYDLVIIGGGPAGLAAAVYGASEGLSTVLIEREAPGGQAGSSSRIENYLGFPVGLSGGELARRAVTQAKRFGVEILSPQEATKIRLKDPYRIIHLADGSEISCYAVLLALGVSWRRLDVPGLERLTGAGVYYGAAQSEAIACKDEDVFIVGGANSAGQAAVYFAQHARSVTMLVRADSLTKSMSQYLIERIEGTDNIKVLTNTVVVEAKGESNLEAIAILNVETGSKQTISAKSLFILIGASPETDWLEGVVERDEKGFILAGTSLIKDGHRPPNWTQDRDPYLLETSTPGIFVAGDVRYDSIKRVASGVGEGSIAVKFIHQYLSTL